TIGSESFGPGVGAEQVVERAVLEEEHDDVIDRDAGSAPIVLDPRAGEEQPAQDRDAEQVPGSHGRRSVPLPVVGTRPRLPLVAMELARRRDREADRRALTLRPDMVEVIRGDEDEVASPRANGRGLPLDLPRDPSTCPRLATPSG